MTVEKKFLVPPIIRNRSTITLNRFMEEGGRTPEPPTPAYEVVDKLSGTRFTMTAEEMDQLITRCFRETIDMNIRAELEEIPRRAEWYALHGIPDPELGYTS